jgi:hypothetical protein
MRNAPIAVLTVITVLLFSCGNQTNENDRQSTSEIIEVTKDTIETEGGLSLDNGKLWLANQETTTGVNNMIDLMNDFTEKDNVESYGELTEKLKSEFTTIFEKCTMKDEAHNQLHNFLIPINELFEGLSATDLNKCKASYAKMNHHLAVYKDYFQ